MAEFYKSLNIEASSTECLSARSLNYICGCSDTSGYAGADSEAKMKGLTWFPRVGAILSILVSDRHLKTIHSAYFVEWHTLISGMEFIL